jgi:hypothetical protein
MRTRSSRFFVILLHLVGVSHHLPRSRRSGIVGVQPWPIVLETVKIGEFSLGSTEPVWLQDSTDKTCLGPTGKFTECGDATLWFVIQVRQSLLEQQIHDIHSHDGNENEATRRERRRKPPRMGLFGIEEDYYTSDEVEEEEPLVWSFQVVDRDYSDPEEQTPERTSESTSRKRPWWKKSRRIREPQPVVECLLTTTTTTAADSVSRGIQVDTCLLPQQDDNNHRRRRSVPSPPSSSSLVNAWAWKISEQGVFISLADLSSSSDQQQQQQQQRCLWRANGTLAVLDDCSAPEEDTDQRRKVNFSVVRYRAVTVSATSTSSRSQLPPKKVQAAAAAKSKERDHLPPSNKAMANRAASEHLPFSLLKDTNPILLMGNANLGGGGRTRSRTPSEDVPKEKEDRRPPSNKAMANRAASEHLPFRLLKDTNPILLMGHANLGGGGRTSTKQTLSRTSTGTTPPSLVHSVPKESYIPPPRMHVHPYIATAKNEVWKDPSTGLEYFTDLCHYMGRDRKEYGRHTLTGVGQYRKGYVVKVYGIAHYVSKRDVLADKIFEQYAGLSAEELRASPDFYETLREMPSPSHPGQGMFDRTILLKINMQLSAATMRSSLHADWKLLTDEAKDTLITSSLEPRPANDAMLKIISSPDNPSRCSCSQVAPEEYQADPSCCARGTELGFTWLRSGHLEVSIWLTTSEMQFAKL